MKEERTEALRQEWRDRLTRILEPMLPQAMPPLEDPLLKFADPGPPQDVRLSRQKRHRWFLRLRGR